MGVQDQLPDCVTGVVQRPQYLRTSGRTPFSHPVRLSLDEHHDGDAAQLQGLPHRCGHDGRHLLGRRGLGQPDRQVPKS